MAVQSSSSFFQYGFSYDAFISFRGTDTRYCFAGNLCKALRDRGIRTFFDDDELQRGEEITPALVKAIQESRIAIPIFSEDYASSSFCLDELVHIMECFKSKGHLVLPVFYVIDPSRVRHQKGKYEEALAMHQARFTNNKINKWKMALNQAANFSGYHYMLGDGYEHAFIGKIVEDVSRKINRVPLPIADYPVGLESRVRKVNSLLDVGSNDGVHMVGIHGIGGIGKTTLALAVYNSIADNFDGSCFLENVRENSSKHGLMHLQKIILSELLGEHKIELTSVRQGISITQHRLQRKKILLILDDIDKKEQLQAFVGRPYLFGLGSRVIITTRDKQLLACFEINRTYEVEELNEDDALQLLSWNAFKTQNVNPSYKNAMSHMLIYASGLPLALEAIGSNLFGKSIEEWKSAIRQYERIPNNQILNILKVSFDTLEEEEKSVFLDIACCFKGYTLAELEDILSAHYGDCVIHQIGVLVEKSLIKISGNKTRSVTLHDLIEDMGKEIVRQESPKEPGERSRLWSPQDIVQVLEEDTGTSKIEIIYLDFPANVEWDGKALKKMRNLRALIIQKGHFSEGPEHLPNSLRVLDWKRYPSQYLPADFLPKKLVVCRLHKNFFTSFKLTYSSKKLVNLKVLKFDNCKYLTEIHDVSNLPNLEELSFRECGNLSTIHSSVGLLDKLKTLDAYHCIQIRSFPSIKLTSLEQLDIRYCTSLESFPEILGNMENITKLDLLGTSIQELPVSFPNLSRLQMLRLRPKGSFRLPSCNVMMPTLTKIEAYELEQWFSLELDKGEEKAGSTTSSNVEFLNFQDCNLSQKRFTSYIRWFANVQELNMSMSNFTILPECIKESRFLRNLILNDCYHLQEVKGIPPNLKYFSARNCESLTSSSRSMLLDQELHEARSMQFFLPGASFPKWFVHQTKKYSKFSFRFFDKFPSIILCLLVQPGIYLFHLHFCLSINGRKDIYSYHDIQTHSVLNIGHICLLDWTKDAYFRQILRLVRKNEWNYVEIEVKGEDIGKYIDIGMHVLKHESGMEDISFTNPYEKINVDEAWFQYRNN